jgi:hypothetical protein
MYAAIIDALTPIVGRPIAQICVRSSTVSLGKSVDALTPADMPHVARTIRESLGSLTTQATLDRAIDEIESAIH